MGGCCWRIRNGNEQKWGADSLCWGHLQLHGQRWVVLAQGALEGCWLGAPDSQAWKADDGLEWRLPPLPCSYAKYPAPRLEKITWRNTSRLESMITTVFLNQAILRTFQTLPIHGLAGRPPCSRSPEHSFQTTTCNARPEVTVTSATVLNPQGFTPLKTLQIFPLIAFCSPALMGTSTTWFPTNL